MDPLARLYEANSLLQERQRHLEAQLVDAQLQLLDNARLHALEAENAKLNDKLKHAKTSVKGLSAALAAERARRLQAERQCAVATKLLKRHRQARHALRHLARNQPLDDDDDDDTVDDDDAADPIPDFPDFFPPDDDNDHPSPSDAPPPIAGHKKRSTQLL